MIEIRRTDNFDIVTSDPEKLSRWYHEILGFPYLLKWDSELGIAAVTGGDFDIFFLKTDSKEHSHYFGENPDHEPGGHMSLGFEVEDCRQAVKELGNKVKWAGPVHYFEHPAKKKWSYHYAYFYDPDGNMLHLTEPRNMPDLEVDEPSEASSAVLRRVYANRESLPPKKR